MNQLNLILILLVMIASCSEDAGYGDQTLDPENWVVYNDQMNFTFEDFEAEPVETNTNTNSNGYYQIVTNVTCEMEFLILRYIPQCGKTIPG